MTVNLDQLREWVEPTVTLLGFLAAFCGAVWAMLRRAQRWLETLKALVSAVKQLRLDTIQLSAKMDETTSELSRLRVSVDQRERDLSRLEGKLEMTHRDAKETDGNLREVIGNLKALWSTLRAIHPDRVPKRASDGG